MPKFKVNVVQTLVRNGYIIVQADTEDEAKEMALYEADNEEFVYDDEEAEPEIEIVSVEPEGHVEED